MISTNLITNQDFILYFNAIPCTAGGGATTADTALEVAPTEFILVQSPKYFCDAWKPPATILAYFANGATVKRLRRAVYRRA